MQAKDVELLHKLCQIFAPSGNEVLMKEFLLDYVAQNQEHWKIKPQIIQGEHFQDGFLLVFGKPRTVVFAHMDSIGFMVRYEKELVRIGGTVAKTGYKLIGKDSFGDISCQIKLQKSNKKHKKEQKLLTYDFDRKIETGTELVFECDFRETPDFVQSCYLDNRLGILNVLKLAENLENGVIAFSCWEETAGGSVGYLAKYIADHYAVKQALISDITWITKGVKHGKGVVISLRDSLVPRRSYVQKIIALAKKSGIDFQLEVEEFGGSDAKDLQRSDYAWDWCFVGAAEEHVHSPNEMVHKHDAVCMFELYQYLFENL
ncbi:MAG: aminopeptidase [Bacteroidetes bacterium]|nr:MAG: aminopeptidase [Bacteroidota bacterium]